MQKAVWEPKITARQLKTTRVSPDLRQLQEKVDWKNYITKISKKLHIGQKKATIRHIRT